MIKFLSFIKLKRQDFKKLKIKDKSNLQILNKSKCILTKRTFVFKIIHTCCNAFLNAIDRNMVKINFT